MKACPDLSSAYQLHALDSGRLSFASRGCKSACVGDAMAVRHGRQERRGRFRRSANGRTGTTVPTLRRFAPRHGFGFPPKTGGLSGFYAAKRRPQPETRESRECPVLRRLRRQWTGAT